ncbi:P-loop containing nucleoside triphosphate hydrolase protein [Aspergillus leporis]|uniref:P-loop containing nucleoside triphosphate hydrolase protein n=1 Tax=Aspergillus leporis TaxID=41062 RepID=A0A5N5WPT0_9EURO|nr:P-loop containing nucleoside triphosphate hydrolase protein [Aspergillus leporis]
MGQQPSVPFPGTRIQVIGAGLPRTGTASFSEALKILLNGPVFHCGTQNTIGPPIEITSWMKILRHWLRHDRQETLELLQRRLDGYAAITDSPGSQLVPELLELYPDAMVICTVRDPMSWEKSVTQVSNLCTVWCLRLVLLPLPGMRYFIEYVNLVGDQWAKMYGVRQPDRRTFLQHIEWLKEIVPEERLVFFDVKDGWEPLCKALGKDIPDIPFPQINDSDEIGRIAKLHIQRGLMRWAGLLAGVGVAMAAFMMW